ncbi:gliding-motility protein MglA [candidate division KSB1 bacterium 4572_119]|nr:MAG: gliding-motility protein MglA [candidate division KSB1 bacterium 4572_119]
MFINWATNEITLKIVYYGPGLSGKTTNLEFIYNQLDPAMRGDLITLNTQEDRTLFFDFLKLEFGSIMGKKPRFNLYTVPGQVYYAKSRKLILSGVDGIVFVADTQKERMGENLNTLLDLEENLIGMGRTLESFPWVLQLNKVDLPNREHNHILTQKLNYFDVPQYESIAPKGIGVFETLKSIINLVIANVQKNSTQRNKT